MFLTEDPGRARRLAGKLQRLNALRQETERAVYVEAAEVCQGEDPVTVVSGDGWHRGVIGIVASRLVERFGRPALVISTDGAVAHGSARSVPGFNMVAALDAVADHLTAYGGHHQAAGFHLPTNQVDGLRQSLIDHAGHQDPETLRATLTCDAVLEPEAITTALALELERLAPFGVGNPRPRFLCPDLQLAVPPRLLKEEHVKLQLRGPEADIEALAWRRADLAESLLAAERVSLVATLRARKWQGRLTAQLEISDISA
jgi:single-stranded-DNA-specific exonuclease